jgi:pyruvate dehydrogenase E1 component
MDNGVFGPNHEPNDSDEHERGMPKLHPNEDASHRHVRMDIAEGAALSCVGSLGLMEQQVGVRFLPAVTIYDFFIKRALDQLFYGLYSGASFLVLGTPSGVSLSSEGAQHCWKSDFQMPGMITWEPSFSIELDWIVHESLVRMATANDAGRNGVLLRLVTRGIPQKLMLERLRRQAAYKQDLKGELSVSLETS